MVLRPPNSEEVIIENGLEEVWKFVGFSDFFRNEFRFLLQIVHLGSET